MSETASASVRTISTASSTVAPSNTAAYSDFIRPPAVSGGYRSSCWMRADSGPGRPASIACARSFGIGAQKIGGVVGVQLLHDPPQPVVRQVLDNLLAGDRRDQAQDLRRHVGSENAKNPVPGLGPFEEVDELRRIGRMQRGHRALTSSSGPVSATAIRCSKALSCLIPFVNFGIHGHACQTALVSLRIVYRPLGPPQTTRHRSSASRTCRTNSAAVNGFWTNGRPRSIPAFCAADCSV